MVSIILSWFSKNSSRFLTTFLLLLSLRSFSNSSSFSHSSKLHPLINDSQLHHRNFTGVSDFRVVNRRFLGDCPDLNPYQEIKVVSGHQLGDEQHVMVTVSGVLFPSELDWIGMISPSHSDVGSCPFNVGYYAQTGDFSKLPLLCHYPVKAALLSSDPDYLSCKKRECKRHTGGRCDVRTCNGSVSFHVINIRTDIQFVFFAGGFAASCVIAKSAPLSFSNPIMPLHGHLSSVDSSATSMRVTWVSGDNKGQLLQYGDGKTQTSTVTTFTQHDMCSTSALVSPAKDFGWHDPGFIHSAIMTGLKPSTIFTYKYGSDSAGWSNQIMFKTPPAGGSDELRFIAFGDMGKAPRDKSIEHYIQPGSISVVEAMVEEVKSGNVDSIFHIGDISYATGFLVEWDYFLHLITPLASRVSYMTAIGNHERDYLASGSVYPTPDSGGECGVPYETYFQMPSSGKDKPWYSIEQGSVHFTVISTEHNWSINSEQYNWMKNDMASVDRSKTPWLVFTGHRPMYTSSSSGFFSKDPYFISVIEPLLIANKVDLVLFGHVHNYERTCSVYLNKCLAMPRKELGIDTYDHNNYKAPVHAIIGMAGFALDKFPDLVDDSWSLKRVSAFGYLRAHATKEELKLELVNAITKNVDDSFRIIKRRDLSNRKINIG